jgi:hypothetical protein
VSLETTIEQRAKTVADEFTSRLGLSEACATYAPHTFQPQGVKRRHLVLDDVSEIPFLDGISAVEFYQLRARIRAEDGDCYAATCPAVPGYENYNANRLGLGAAEYIHAPPDPLMPIEIARACGLPGTFDRLVGMAKEAGGLTVHPYMGTHSVWELAKRLSEHADCPVDVLAPPPPVTWLANDKVLLSEFAQAILKHAMGRSPTVPTRIAHTLHELSSHLVELAHTHSMVAIKMARCASAMGNALIPSQEVLSRHSSGSLEAWVDEVLTEKQWDGHESILAVAWLESTASPSTQLWIPPLGYGKPRLEGIYEQLLEGDTGIFQGSFPSQLSHVIEHTLTDMSLALTLGLQHLGYVGRCSFDFIIHESTPYLVECNGRWGGTSIPMHLVNRLFPEGRPAYRARDVVVPELIGRSFSDLEAALDKDLFTPATGHGRYLLYNVGCLNSSGKFDVVALGEDLDAATYALEVDLPLRLAAGLGS